jgi:hypothetical protein
VKPFLRPTSRARLAPVGWISEQAGVWAGREVEVVYDPARHQVVLFRNDPGDTARAELAGAGYRRYASDGRQEMWVRDTAATSDASLGRPTPTPTPAHGQGCALSLVGGGGRSL